MTIKTNDGNESVASAGVGNTALGLGIAGTALGLMSGGVGLLGNGGLNGKSYVTKEELDLVQQLQAKDIVIASKDSALALKESESYTDDRGVRHTGAHWSLDEIRQATHGKSFKPSVTDCDKWVAYNAMYADISKSYEDADVFEIAYLYYFADEDWQGDGKVWQVMQCNR